MTVLDNQKLEYFKETMEELARINREVPVVVEGERDVEALRKLGLEGRIEPLNQGMSIFVFCETLAREFDRVVLLTDWDEKGRELHDRLMQDMQANGVKPDDEFWKRLMKMSSKNISSVEELYAFFLWLKEN